MQFPPRDRRISRTVLSRTKKLMYLLLWKTELQKHAFYLLIIFRRRSRMLPRKNNCFKILQLQQPSGTHYTDNSQYKLIAKKPRKYFCQCHFFLFKPRFMPCSAGKHTERCSTSPFCHFQGTPCIPSLVILSDILAL